jgi:hypothetical protein
VSAQKMQGTTVSLLAFAALEFQDCPYPIKNVEAGSIMKNYKHSTNNFSRPE